MWLYGEFANDRYQRSADTRDHHSGTGGIEHLVRLTPTNNNSQVLTSLNNTKLTKNDLMTIGIIIIYYIIAIWGERGGGGGVDDR